MRWITTILLIALVACGILWLAFGERARRAMGWGPPLETASLTVSKLKNASDPKAITRIVRTLPGQTREDVDLTREATGEWVQPGKWPVRQADADELAKTITELKSRFIPIEITAGSDLKPFGLDKSQEQTVLRVYTGDQMLTLKFGQAADEGKESFGRSTYLRLDDAPEVLRFGPDVQAAIAKSTETYRRRQLFPDVTRVKLTGGEPPPNPMNPAPPPAAGRIALPTDKVKSVTIESPGVSVVLNRTALSPLPQTDPDRPGSEPSLTAARLAAVWELSQANGKPMKDKVDPAKLRTLLAAIPDFWAEQFVDKPDSVTGLDKPERSLILTFEDNKARALRIGKMSRQVVREGGVPPPTPPFGQPPPPPTTITETYYYAKLDNNPLVFEIRADKFSDLFTPAEDFRDATLARIESGDVTRLSIRVKGQPPIEITKKKGDKNAAKDDEKQDRWYLGDRLAEGSKVTELIDALGRLEAKTKEERLDGNDSAKLATLGIDAASTQVAVSTKDKTTTFLIGKHDVEKKKLNIQVAGWPRVNVVADDVLKLIDRPALAYRGRRLFDTSETKLSGVTVVPTTGEAFAIKVDVGNKWQFTQPFAAAADEAKASQITGDLARLEVIEFVDDAPKPEDLDRKYGLTKPAYTLNLDFDKGPAKTIEIGAVPEFKQEYYARIRGANSVFTLPKDKVDALTIGAVSLLPLQLWTVSSDKILAIEVDRAVGEKYKLTLDAGNWKLAGSFDAPVPYLMAQTLLAASANLVATKYETLITADLVKYGLDKPTVKLTVTFKEMKGDKEEIVAKTVVVGAITPDNPAMRYAKLEGSPSVFVIADSLAKEADKPALDRLDRTLYSVDPATITKVAIIGQSADKNTTLIRDGVNWNAEGKPYTVDTLSAMAVLNAASRPMASRLAAYGGMVKLGEYGLDKPDYTVTVTLADGKSHIICLGKPAPGGGRFAKVDDALAIAVFADPVVNALSRAPLDFVDRTMLSFDHLQLAGLTRQEGTETLELAPSLNAGWDVVKPFKQKADQPLMDELADQLSRLRAASVAAYSPDDLGAFGLSKPHFTITLKVGLEKPEDKVLKIGNETDDGISGDRYATTDSKTIGVLPGDLVARLTAVPLKFRDRSLAKFIDADRATLVRGDRDVTFAKVNGTWKVVKPVNAEAEQGELDELINAVARLRADELVVEKPESLVPYGLGKPEATWTFANGEKVELRLSLGHRDKSGDRVYARIEGSDIVALLDPSVTNRLTAEYRKRSVWAGVDAAQIETVAISAGMTSFSFRKQGADWIDPVQPTEKMNSAALTELLDALAGLKVERYVVDEKADLKLYGLEPPERVIVLTTRTGTKTLHIGRQEGGQGGRVYARIPEKDRTEVFVLNVADSEKLLKNRAAYVVRPR